MNNFKDIDKKDKKENGVKVFLKDSAIVLISSIILAFVAGNFIRFSTVIGHSMDNTLFDGERLLVNRHIYRNNTPERGDIVIVERNDLSIQYLVKRVIAVEGDSLEIKNNVVYLNDEPLVEDYILEDMFTDDLEKIVIPEGKIFVMGDNRNNSMDSRNKIIGLVDIEDELFGKVFFSISTKKSL